jgi:hypothetical protein
MAEVCINSGCKRSPELGSYCNHCWNVKINEYHVAKAKWDNLSDAERERRISRCENMSLFKYSLIPVGAGLIALASLFKGKLDPNSSLTLWFYLFLTILGLLIAWIFRHIFGTIVRGFSIGWAIGGMLLGGVATAVFAAIFELELKANHLLNIGLMLGVVGGIIYGYLQSSRINRCNGPEEPSRY